MITGVEVFIKADIEVWEDGKFDVILKRMSSLKNHGMSYTISDPAIVGRRTFSTREEAEKEVQRLTDHFERTDLWLI